jgi:hypothetical protein
MPIFTGCALVEAKEAKEKSEAAYRKCLAANPSKVANCEGKRITYQLDKDRADGIAKALQGMGNSTSNQQYTQPPPMATPPRTLDCRSFPVGDGSMITTRCN